MKTHYTFFIIGILLSCLAVGYASDIVLPSSWRDSVIIIDGSPKDWGEHPMAYFKQAGVSLGVMNDNRDVYLLLNFKNQSSGEFLQNNVTVWFDKTNKDKKFFGICYHGARPPMDSSRINNKERWSNMASRNDSQHYAMPETMIGRTVIINNKDTLKVAGNDSNYGVQIVSKYEAGFYCHELKIPLQLIDSLSYASSKILGEKISVGLELGMKQEDFKGIRPKDGERPEMPSGMPPGGGTNRGSGMGSGDFPGSPPSGMSGMQMPEKQQCWIKVIFASDPSHKIENK